MEIIKGKLVINHTRRYLITVLRDYGDTLLKKLNSLSLLAFGINDAVAINDMGIFILIDYTYNKSNFVKVLDWIRKQDYFIKDYPYDNIIDGFKHMIVLKVPNQKAFKHFINSEFSKMFTKEEAKKYYGNKPEYHIVVRDKLALTKFVEYVNDKYNTDHDEEDFKDVEFEFNIEPENEVFNYNLKNKNNG